MLNSQTGSCRSMGLIYQSSLLSGVDSSISWQEVVSDACRLPADCPYNVGPSMGMVTIYS